MDVMNNGTRAVHLGAGALLEPGETITVSKSLGTTLCDVSPFCVEVKPKKKPKSKCEPEKNG